VIIRWLEKLKTAVMTYHYTVFWLIKKLNIFINMFWHHAESSWIETINNSLKKLTMKKLWRNLKLVNKSNKVHFYIFPNFSCFYNLSCKFKDFLACLWMFSFDLIKWTNDLFKNIILSYRKININQMLIVYAQIFIFIVIHHIFL
jgi:hypothetical protein